VKWFLWPVLLVSMAVARVAFAEEAATGPSFDCGKAESTLDRTICDDAELAGLDRSMAAGYKAALKAADETGQALLKDAQRQWARGRAERCALPADGAASPDAVACLKQLYQARVAELGALEPAGAEDPVAWVEGLWQVDDLLGVADASLTESAAKGFVGRLVHVQRSAIANLSGDSCSGPNFRVLPGSTAITRLEITCLGTTLVELSWNQGAATRTITWTERGASFSLKRVATATQLRLSRGIGQDGVPDPAEEEPLE
jgi:uncharacterized protein